MYMTFSSIVCHLPSHFYSINGDKCNPIHNNSSDLIPTVYLIEIHNRYYSDYLTHCV